jgi:hypothetical protein
VFQAGVPQGIVKSTNPKALTNEGPHVVLRLGWSKAAALILAST